MLSGLRPNLRNLVLVLLASTMVLSLIYSNSIQYGHADVPAAQTAAEIQPLKAGDNAPFFTVETVDDERFDFDPRKLERPALLISFRGGWCPFCNMHLSELRHVIPEINRMGIDVLFLSGDRPELLFSSLKRETQDDIAGLGYTILSDANAQAAVALGIAFKVSARTIKGRHNKGQDIEESSMARHGVLPVPAVFAVNSAGTITFAYANPNYKVRVPVDELLAAAREIAIAE